MFYYKKECRERKFLMISVYGNFKVLTQMFMLLMNDENVKVKITIVNVLQKVKKEFTDIMSVELDDDYDLI